MDLRNASISKLLWYYSVPSLVGTLANALYNIVDRIYIGQGVGALAISGLALTFPIMNILGAFGMLVGQGAAARVSLYLGNGNIKSANLILANALYLSLFIFAVVGALLYIFIDPILVAFGGTEQIIPYARTYMKIIIPWHVFTSVSFSFNNIMRASGHPRLAMYTLLIGAVLNIILDPLFIYGFGMGIEGVAYATVISMFISSAWVMSFFIGKRHTLHFTKGLLYIDFKIIGAILSIGLSPFLLNMALSVVNVLMNNTLLAYGGDLAIGALGIITSYTSLVVMAVIGLCQGMQPIVGYNYGAQQYARVRHALKLSITVASSITFIGWALAMIMPEVIVGCFTSDSELTGISIYGMRTYVSMFFIVGFHIVSVNYFQSIGRAGVSILLSLSRQILFVIPLLLVLPSFFRLDGVWLVQPVSDICSAALAMAIMYIHLKKLPQNNSELL